MLQFLLSCGIGSTQEFLEFSASGIDGARAWSAGFFFFRFGLDPARRPASLGLAFALFWGDDL